MKQVTCRATVPNDALIGTLSFVQAVANGGYHRDGNTIKMTYTQLPTDWDRESKYWSIVHFFEQFPEHEIKQTEV